MDENPIQKRNRLKREIAQGAENLKSKKRELERLSANCRHEWGPTETAFIHHKGYTIPGDALGTMGVDHRGPFYVSPKTDKRWKRVCTKCGEIDYTTSVNKTTVETPKW